MEKVRSSKINVSWNDMGIFIILALLIADNMTISKASMIKIRY